MLDIRLLREESDRIKEDLKRRPNFDTKIVDDVLEVDLAWRELKSSLDILKSKKNKESKAISEVKKKGGDINSQIEKVGKIADEIKLKEEELVVLENQRDNILSRIPNILDKEVPKGVDDEDNVTLRTYLDKPSFGFKVRNHQELCEMNDWYDLSVAAKVSGSRFYYLKNELVMLQLALYNYTFNKLLKRNFVPIEVPPMLRREFLGKSVSLEDFEEVIYKIEDEDLYLIGTSEHALAALHENENLNHKDLPLRYAGISACFRKEAGVTKDSKGIFRVHNFNKIEQFIFSKQEDSDKLHDEIIEIAEDLFRGLEIHYRVVDICSGDIGNFASRKFDIEAWLPSQEKYREMVSASNYRDYGARRLNVRYQDSDGKTKFCHTLNSTAIALTRVMIAIIETHQTKDGNVKIPKELRQYLGGKEFLK